MQDSYKEVTVIVIAGAVLFMVFAGVIIYFLFLNQKKKFQHAKDLLSIGEKYKAEMLQAQLEMQEQTFNHISQEIHDNVGQILSLAKVQVNIINESDKMNRDLLIDLKDNIGKAMGDLRDIAKSLNSEHIRSLSVQEAVAHEVKRINKSGIVHIDVISGGDHERKMDQQKKLILFRIIQEGIQNILKHAKAAEVLINFKYLPDTLETTIRDDGRGFNYDETLRTAAGLGLSNIKTRASLSGGSVCVESAPGQGTILTIQMPYE